MIAGALVAFVAWTACSDSSDSPLAPEPIAFSHGSSGVVQVTNANGSGPGSFANAIQAANADPSIQRIVFSARLGSIPLAASAIYTGAQSLTLEGRGATLDGQALAAGAGALVATGGGDLEIRSLGVRGAPGVGITVAVPATATGTIKVTLHDVTIRDNGSHGVLINDQAEYFIDPNSTSPAGSDASLDVRVLASVFENNGFTALDQDGLRINEGGQGDLKADILLTRVEGNGGDGIELDERGAGDVQASVNASAMDRNGGFDAADFDDGIDIDEAGPGSILGNFVGTSASHNFEQGYDINENDEGDIRLDMLLVKAIGNSEEGIEYEEDDDFAGGGDIVANLIGIVVRENGSEDGDAGLKLREKGPGNLSANLVSVESSRNFITGILLREDADGNASAKLRTIVADGNDGDGLEFDENSTGNLAAEVTLAKLINNTDAGIRADQGSAGTGLLRLVNVALTGNGAGPIIANAGVTVTQN
jgi:hypothetical protein